MDISNIMHIEFFFRRLVIFGLGVSCLQLYMQNNWVGPPTTVDPRSLFPSCCQPLLQVLSDICWFTDLNSVTVKHL